VHGVPNKSVRGEHAHHHCHQFLIATSGPVTVSVDDGNNRASFVLDSLGRGLYVASLNWGNQFHLPMMQCYLYLPHIRTTTPTVKANIESFWKQSK
jgi:hypothetical protein